MPGRLRQLLLDAALVLIVGGALAYAGLIYYQRARTPAAGGVIDMPAVFRANNRGVGHMERFEYEKAAAAFEEATQLAPDWVPGRINLGIALLNTNTPE